MDKKNIILIIALCVLILAALPSCSNKTTIEDQGILNIIPQDNMNIAANPINEITPNLENPDDTDNLYAMYKVYEITANVSDADGYTDIANVSLVLWNDARSIDYWTITYIEDTDSFSETDYSDLIELYTVYSDNVSSGNWIYLTFYLNITWAHPDISDVDIQQIVYDDSSNSDSDYYEVNWDFETRLDYSIAPNVDDNNGTIDRGSLDGIFYTSGTITYYGFSNRYPLSIETDVWISMEEYGTNVGPWSGDVDGSGRFNITCYADDSVGDDVLTIKVVEEGTGAGGTDLYYTTTVTDVYISDAVGVSLYVDDARVNIGDTVRIYVYAAYVWNDDNVASGSTFKINGTTCTYQSGSIWYLDVSQSSVCERTYVLTDVFATDHGITTIAVIQTPQTSNGGFVVQYQHDVAAWSASEVFSFWIRMDAADDGIIRLWSYSSAYVIYDNATQTLASWNGTAWNNISCSVYMNVGTWYHLLWIVNDTAGTGYRPDRFYINGAYQGFVDDFSSFDIHKIGATGTSRSQISNMSIKDFAYGSYTWYGLEQCFNDTADLYYRGQLPSGRIGMDLLDLSNSITDNIWGSLWCYPPNYNYWPAWPNPVQKNVTIVATAYSDCFVKPVWDRVSAVVEFVSGVYGPETDWNVAGYYLRIKVDGTMEFDGKAYAGEIDVYSLTEIGEEYTPSYEYVKKDISGNYSFYATSANDIFFGITTFITNTAYGYWDNITYTSLDYYIEITQNYKLFAISFDQLVWESNGTSIGSDWLCTNYLNGSEISNAVTSLGYLYPYWQYISLTTAWTGIAYVNTADGSVGAFDYQINWFSMTTELIESYLLMRNLIMEKLEDVISVSGTVNTNVSWLIYNEGILSGEGGIINVTYDGIEEGFQITFDIVLSVGQHNFSVYFETNSGEDQWFNQSYYVNFDIDIEIPEQKGSYMEIKGISNLDCYWYVYLPDDSEWYPDNGTIDGGNNYFQFLFLLETDPGLHNYSLYFNITSSVYVWKNGSYYVGDVYGLVTVTLYDSQSNVFLDNNYKMYINGTRSASYTFYNRTDYSYNLTFTDYFGYAVYSNTFDYNRFIDIQLSVYTFKVYSEMSSEFIYFNLTRSGGATFSQHLGPGEILTYRLIAGDYQYDFKKVNGPNFDYYTGTFTLSADTSYVISDISLKELWLDVMNDVNAKTSLKPIMAAVNSMSSTLVIMQWTLLGLVLLVVGMMLFRGYTEEEPTGPQGKKKKRTLPKQLEKFKFGKGSKNPRFGGIPKGAGQGAWSRAGVAFKKDEDEKK